MLFNTATTPLNHFIFSNGTFEIWKDEISNHHSLFSVVDFQPGDIICEFGAAAILPAPSFLTVQVGINEHIYLQPGVLQYINHSCAPNVFFDTTAMQVVALKHIEDGEEMTFFYPSSEWEMKQSFQCYCGSPACLGEIKGSAYIAKNILKQYRLTDFIQQQVTKRSAKKVRA